MSKKSACAMGQLLGLVGRGAPAKIVLPGQDLQEMPESHSHTQHRQKKGQAPTARCNLLKLVDGVDVGAQEGAVDGVEVGAREDAVDGDADGVAVGVQEGAVGGADDGVQERRS